MKKEKVRLGVIGLGGRGHGLVRDAVLPNPNAEVTMVCDVYPDRVERTAELVKEKTGKRPETATDYQAVLASPVVDAVLISSSWQTHIPIAIDALRAKKAVAMEVGNAFSIQQCWELVRAWEETQTPFMFMENCCFGRRELLALNMVRQGIFGEVVHCAGGYHHDLREEITFGWDNRHYRLDNYLLRCCDNYPTHELGPIANILGINRGNRMLSLTSTASKSAGLAQYVRDKKPDDPKLQGRSFRQGDVVTTVVKCAGGETIALTLDTCLPRYYSRGFTVRGTKGMYEEATDSIFLTDQDEAYDYNWKPMFGNAEKYLEQYEHPIWQEYLRAGVQGSHDGMDWLEFVRFFQNLLDGKPMELDVYDAASWMCIGALSEDSIAMGGAPVAIPDFTDGKWLTRKPIF